MEIYIICKCIVEGQVAGSAQTFALRLKNNLIINIYHRRPWPPLSSRPLNNSTFNLDAFHSKCIFNNKTDIF